MSKEETQSETPEPEAPAAVTDETDVSSSIEKLAGMVVGLSDQMVGVTQAIDTLAQLGAAQQQQIEALASSSHTVTLPEEAAAPKLHGVPEGTTRFFSPTKEYTIWVEPAERILVDGRPVFNRGVKADFSNGIFDTRDEKLADYLRNHPAHGVEYWEAPDARPHPGPTVVDGPKSTGSRATARPPEELAARL